MLVFSPRKNNTSDDINPFFCDPWQGVFLTGGIGGVNEIEYRFMCERLQVDPANHVQILTEVSIPTGVTVRVYINGIAPDGFSHQEEYIDGINIYPLTTEKKYMEITSVVMRIIDNSVIGYTVDNVANHITITNMQGGTLWRSEENFMGYYNRVIRGDVNNEHNEPYSGHGQEMEYWYPCVNLINTSLYYEYKDIIITCGDEFGLNQVPKYTLDCNFFNNVPLEYDALTGPQTDNLLNIEYSNRLELRDCRSTINSMILKPGYYAVIVLKVPISAIDQTSRFSLSTMRLRTTYKVRSDYDEYTSSIFDNQ